MTADRVLCRPSVPLALMLATVALTLPAPLRAQQGRGGGQQHGGNDGQSDDIVVTGQAPPGAVIGDIPATNRISAAEIAAYGVGTISELLDEIAAQTQSDQGRDDSSGPVVLVNGRRISGVNEVGDLPTEAVVRVDILPEEVALRYGYDAQRKVVNVILRRRFRSRVASIAGGMATAGQGQTLSAEGGYTRIHDNDRVNITARAQSAASLRESDRAIRREDGDADDAAWRTLSPATRSYMLGGTIAHEFSRTVNGSFNLRGSYATSEALDGLPEITLLVPTGRGRQSITRTISSADPLRRDGENGALSANFSLNVDLSTRWRLSLIGGYSHAEAETTGDLGYAATALQAAIDRGDPTVDPYGDLPAGLLGALRREHTRSVSDSGNASLLLTGPVVTLPAGDMRVSLRASGDASTQRSETDSDARSFARTVDQRNGGGQVSLDIPIASRSKGFLSALGTLSANVNAGVTDVSDYGALSTFGYGLNWTPFTGLSLIAAVNEDRNAPSLMARSAPVTTIENVRVYDFVRGETVLVTRIGGGNAALRADDRRTTKLGITAKPVSSLNLVLSANYIDSRTRNPVGAISGVTSALEAAFPERFVRDEDGELTLIDSRSLNFAREDRRQLRWGLTFSTVLRAPRRPERPSPGAGAPPWARRPGEGERGSQQDASRDMPAGEGAQPPAATRPEGEGERDGGGAPADGGAEGDIVVTGRQQVSGGGEFMPPPPPDGFDGPPPDGPPPGPPPEGFGPPRGGPGGGPGGPGGPGFGPPGGGRGPGGMGGSDNGARLQFSAFHSWIFRDVVVLRSGGQAIDLLDGGTLGGAARPRHQVQADAGVTDNGIGLRLAATWKSGAWVDGGTSASGVGDLRFSPLWRFNLRLFANLANRFRGQGWARGTRVSLSVENLFDARQKVHAADGTTPIAYQAAMLDPMGRTVQLTIRRIF